METYVSYLGKGNTLSPEAIAQNKINACIKTLHEVIDSAVEEKTEQLFYTVEYDGMPTTLECDKPKQPVPVSAIIGNSQYYIGTIDIDGKLIMKTYETTSNNHDYEVAVKVEEVTDREEDEEPKSSEKVESITNINERSEIDGAVITKVGTSKRISRTVVNKAEKEDEDVWIWSGFIAELVVTSLKETIDLSKANVHIKQKYV